MPSRLADLPPVLVDMIESGAYRDASGAVRPMHSNISTPEALTLHEVVRALRPRATAEIGFALGVSGLAILPALEANGGEGRHYACDPGQTSFVANAGLENVRRAGLDHRLEFFEKFPEEVFPQLPPLQFAFIDASHLFDLSILDFLLVDKRLETGGVVAFHDVWMPSLHKVVRYILANRAYRVHPLNPAAPPPSGRQRVKSLLAAAGRRLPTARRWLAPEARRPWHEFGFTNLALLEKTAPGQRDWCDHAEF